MLRFTPRNGRPWTATAENAMRPYTGVLARLLYDRGVNNAKEADAFLHPAFAQLHDPLLLNDMSKALALLEQAKEEQWPAVVYGDYDVDGMCAATLMTSALRQYGLMAEPHVPLREEGYGLNSEAVRALAETHRLMVTVDLGITNAEEIRLAQSLGMRVIVTDHHQLGLEPCPADAVIDPLMAEYPFARLCGTGVAFKVAQALLGAQAAAQWLDLVALATVADIVPLTDENRVLVALGLPHVGERLGLRALMDAADCAEPADSYTLGYQLGPRLNAAGRLADANEGVRLLLTNDPAEAKRLAAELEKRNQERKRLEQTTLAEAQKQAQTHDYIAEPLLMVRGAGWNAGVIGLVAGRLCQQYHVPVCALSEENGLLHGSLRSVRGVNIHKCLQTCDELLLRYGGHEQAAGVTLEASQYEAFRLRLCEAVCDCAPGDAFVPEQEVDLSLTLSEANDTLFDQLQGMQPFGFGNPSPVFWLQNAHLERRRACGAEGAHLQLTLRQNKSVLEGIAFGMGRQAATLPEIVDAAFALRRDTYRGRTTLKCDVKALCASPEHERERLQRISHDEAEAALYRSACDLLTAMRQEGIPSLNGESFKACVQAGEEEQLSEALTGRQGTLCIAYTAETAASVLSRFSLDVAFGVTDDPRRFHTLLLWPDARKIANGWRRIVLLDGPLTENEPAYWAARSNGAQVLVLPQSAALLQAAAALDAGDDSYRALYRLLRKSVGMELNTLALTAGLTTAQTCVGLNAFQSLGLLEWSEAPFHWSLREPSKCSLSDAPLLGALRALQARKEVRAC